MNNILPCPVCGGRAEAWPYGTRHSFVACVDELACGVSGPVRPTLEAAIRAWNGLGGRTVRDALDRLVYCLDNNIAVGPNTLAQARAALESEAVHV